MIHLFPILDVSITNSPTPVNEPTTRGGVYFSDKFAYKMRGIIGESLSDTITDKKDAWTQYRICQTQNLNSDRV